MGFCQGRPTPAGLIKPRLFPSDFYKHVSLPIRTKPYIWEYFRPGIRLGTSRQHLSICKSTHTTVRLDSPTAPRRVQGCASQGRRRRGPRNLVLTQVFTTIGSPTRLVHQHVSSRPTRSGSPTRLFPPHSAPPPAALATKKTTAMEATELPSTASRMLRALKDAVG